jgi:hypothetical protein
MRFTHLAVVASTLLQVASCSLDPDGERNSAALLAGSVPEGCTGPVLGAVSPIRVGCSPVAQNLVPPSVTACSPVTISAVLLTIENGTPVIKPLGDYVLPAGVSSGIVRWTATDADGNSSFADAIIDASTYSLMAAQSLALRDRTQVLDGQGLPAPVSSVGALSVGVEARVGSINSLGGVTLQDRAHVFGYITTSESVSKQNQVTIDGPVAEHVSPTFGPAPSVAGVGQVPSTWSGIDPDQTITLAAGTHDNVRVSSRATLRLAAGRHVFASLSIEPQANVVPGDGLAEIVVVGDFTLHGSIVPAPGSWLRLTLLGSGTYTFETNFTGSVIAPNATLALGAGQQLSFVGSYYARNIEVRPDVVVRCR